jgi:hypothetical protein
VEMGSRLKIRGCFGRIEEEEKQGGCRVDARALLAEYMVVVAAFVNFLMHRVWVANHFVLWGGFVNRTLHILRVLKMVGQDGRTIWQL